MSKGHSLQDPYLNTLRKERVPVSIYLVNGINPSTSSIRWSATPRRAFVRMRYGPWAKSPPRDASRCW